MDAPVSTAPQPTAVRLQERRRTWLTILGVAIAVIALIAVAWWWLYASHYESTDDAYVAGDLVGVMSQVSGTVVSIGADETDRVQAGAELVRLDATDYRIALQEAEQQLARAVRQVHTVFANRDELTALVAQRRADLDRAQADLARRRGLTASGAVSAEELGHAQDAANAAREALTAAQKNLAAGSALVGRTGVADNPDVRAAATQVERAWLNVQRTSVRAPVSGYVARRSVQLGERIAPGTPLLALVTRRGTRAGDRLGVRAVTRAECDRQLDQGGAARAGAHHARSEGARGASAARRTLDPRAHRCERRLRQPARDGNAPRAGARYAGLRRRPHRHPRPHRRDHPRQLRCRDRWRRCAQLAWRQSAAPLTRS